MAATSGIMGGTASRIAQALPFIEAAAQWAHALDAKLMKLHGRLGRRGLAGAGAIKDHVPVSRDLVMARG